MTISKDQSIITQVAAKIAAELTPKGDDVMTNISNWVMAFDACTDALLSKHDMDANAPAVSEANAVANAIAMVTEAFPNTTSSTSTFDVRIKGKQHGPIPEWLGEACRRDGVTEVWDNRDGLAANPKRPWFKAVNGDQAYWAPRGKK
jgi:hypothetical protein